MSFLLLPWKYQLYVCPPFNWISRVDIKLCSLNLNFDHFLHLFWTPPPKKQVTRHLLPVIEKSLTSSFSLLWTCCETHIPWFYSSTHNLCLSVSGQSPRSVSFFFVVSHTFLSYLFSFFFFLNFYYHLSSLNPYLIPETLQQIYLWSTYLPSLSPSR